MSDRSYPYSRAHAHCMDLMEEVSSLKEFPPELMIHLACAARILANKSQELQ